MTNTRERRREERLKSIKDAALRQVVEDGLSNFSIHRLAERLDLTVGALYRYFDSVDHLMMAIQIDVLEGFDAYMSRVMDGLEDEPSLDRIVILCRAYLALEHLQPEPFRLTGRFVSSPEPLFDDSIALPAMEPTVRLLMRLANEIDGAQRDGALDEGRVLERAVVTWSSIQGIVERKKLARLAPELFDVEQLTQALLRTLLMGWGGDIDNVENALANPYDDALFAKALKNKKK